MMVIKLNFDLIIENKRIEVELCNTFKKRLLGFMFQKNKITTGKCFPNCNSIHTFFMFQKIDLLLCDKNQRIIEIKQNFPVNKVLLPIKNAYYVYELPLGSINSLKKGDNLKIGKTHPRQRI